MAKRYCECGRKVVFRYWKNGKLVVGSDQDHVLCQRCWQSLASPKTA